MRIQPGDQVLLRCHPAGRNKIGDRYGPDVFDVLSVPPEQGGGVTGEQRFVSGSGLGAGVNRGPTAGRGPEPTSPQSPRQTRVPDRYGVEYAHIYYV
ncbi:hypothetical protein RRG08_041300 [Elysia crispata]|uniref:Uncharacterized protein n=1 Tax=Elysia crispata TaxID=231223 RepID=A0AAE1DM43_9GAST|nr:hypothetical protein RRG08_041300 [Elysia crispata]